MGEHDHIKQYTNPPEFMTEKNSFKQYRRDVQRWIRCTSVDKRRQGDIILLNIPPTHPLKERLENEIGDEVIDNEDGVKLILDTLESIYGSDQVMESYLLFRDLELKQRQVGQDILDYLSEWETCYIRAKDKGIELQENVKAFKLLMTANLDELDMKLVLSEVDMKSEEGKKKLYNQTKVAIRKYHSAGSLQSHKLASKALFSESQLSQIEEVFVTKGWTRPDEGWKKNKKRRFDEDSLNRQKKDNGTDKDGNWRKCYKCVRECVHGKKKCDCACSQHLLPTCPKLRAEKEN